MSVRVMNLTRVILQNIPVYPNAQQYVIKLSRSLEVMMEQHAMRFLHGVSSP